MRSREHYPIVNHHSERKFFMHVYGYVVIARENGKYDYLTLLWIIFF